MANANNAVKSRAHYYMCGATTFLNLARETAARNPATCHAALDKVALNVGLAVQEALLVQS